MKMDEFCELITEAVDFPVPYDFKADTRFKEIKYWDSLAALGIILMYDSNFSITFTPDHFEKFNTVQELYDFAMSGGA